MRRSWLLVPFLLLACTGAPPSVLEVSHSLVYSRNPASGEQELLLLCSASVLDDDGIDDIEVVYVIRDEAGLYWEVKEEAWDIFSQEGQHWLSFTLASPGADPFPAGTYRLLVRDYGGREAERTFLVKEHPASYPAERFPSLFVQEGSVQSRSTEPLKVVGYDGEGRLLFSRELKPGAFLSREQIPEQVAVLYALIEREGYLLRSGPYAVY
ncbi:hypothetical protein [Spirochaeta thermophila]|uniref:Lipoprotein n=1 Tax=Winmispira thermophila (strain ATCC 49972 / DSM 6192 / RI 19.B1) TaxID=665571 RepID=E0RR38_WINT6|nr:hypothetical protein [Spirochaeta thermophila]ADN01616.1 hypothetical protein STHERM_c06570 [Spirochaeta thermophila DSM 6192]